ncbi:MAG: hypothetical protein EOP07_23895 [Proteobacteria bacterium]|nr:MAG: hypothetical protein EOP07_23895 [Pseudomonadota bacterium]
MKNTNLILGFAALSLLGCGRVAMEQSPEALVSYGLPSQHSNFRGDTKNENDESDKDPTWLTSSAINPKPRLDK